MGFIGYMLKEAEENERVVRVFLECQENFDQRENASGLSDGITYTYAVDIVFPDGKSPCQLRGVDNILVLKKFYKLVFSLEERAREHGNDRLKTLGSVEGLLEHLAYTRNARDFTGQEEPKRRESAEPVLVPDCSTMPGGI